MARLNGFLATALVIAAVLAVSSTHGADPKALTEADVLKLLDLQIGDKAITTQLGKRGVAFAVDDAVLERLKKAGASEEVLAAVKKAGDTKKPAGAGGKAITYQDLLRLLELGLDEADILKRLEKSPTVFTLDETQVEALKKAGASEKLLAAMQGKRPGAGGLGDVTDIAIILDCSGSMIDKTREGLTKMEVAQQVVNELIYKIPDGRRLCLIIYGHNKEEKCEAVKVVKGLTPLNERIKKQFMAEVVNLKPVGHTPIALALRTAGKELAKAEGNSGLILITDGMETCHGDPAKEAASLAENEHLTFGLHVIGFDVDAKERAAVEQIAKAGKGKYYDAQSARKLQAAVAGIQKQIGDEPKAPPVARDPTEPSPRVKRMIEQLKDPEGELRHQAAEKLREYGAEARPAVPALIKRVADEVWVNRGPFVVAAASARYDPLNCGKGAALNALKELAPDKVVEALTPALKSKFPQQRVWAAAELGKLREKAAVPALMDRIADNVWIPKPPFKTAGRMQGYDPVGGGKEAALTALKEIAPERVKEALQKASKSKNKDVRKWAVDLLDAAE
jgi:HEAT repeat protein